VHAQRVQVVENKLPELLQRVRALEQRLERLAARLGAGGERG
jgi:cell division septum initiation protein DivIVA